MEKIDFYKHKLKEFDSTVTSRVLSDLQNDIARSIKNVGLKIVSQKFLMRMAKSSLEYGWVSRNLLVDFGEWGCYLPDVDLVIYEPKTCKVIAVLSSKVTLRERIAQTGYWKYKLASDNVTKRIKVFFITPDEDGTLTFKTPAKEGRAIVETDTDGCYVLSETAIEEGTKIKSLEKFIGDLKKIIRKKIVSNTHSLKFMF
jgi:type II restriction enzyme